MEGTEFSLTEVVAIVFIIGFAIQQALQILDPFVMAAILFYKNSRPNKDLPGGMSDSDFKKAVMALLSFCFGAIAVAMLKDSPERSPYETLHRSIAHRHCATFFTNPLTPGTSPATCSRPLLHT